MPKHCSTLYALQNRHSVLGCNVARVLHVDCRLHVVRGGRTVSSVTVRPKKIRKMLFSRYDNKGTKELLDGEPLAIETREVLETL